ncbi:MAG: helix-turn-helix domain-containing protein [Hyphomicrobiaceae bacterium]
MRSSKNEDDVYLRVPEAARLLRVNERTIYRYLQTKIITRRKVRGRTLISRNEIERLLQTTD